MFDLVWEEPIDGNARIYIVGMFEEEGQWVEKYVDFQIVRTAVGNWILRDEVDFVKTDDQLSIEYQERKKIEDEIQRQENLAELTIIQEAFDMITAEFGSIEYLPATSKKPGVDGFVFHLLIRNPTSQPFEVIYRIEWVEQLSTTVSGQCPIDHWGSMRPQINKVEKDLELKPEVVETLVEFSPTSSRSYLLRLCDDLVVELTNLQIVEINGTTRQDLIEGIAKNQ